MIGDFYVIFDVIFGDFLVGTGEPPPYCDKIPTKSPFCMIVVLVFKKLGLGQTPPSLGQNPNFDRKLVLEAPLGVVLEDEKAIMSENLSQLPHKIRHWHRCWCDQVLMLLVLVLIV